MMDEEEKDVIFEGSPLFEYLKETCPSDEFESSSPLSGEVQRLTDPSPSKKQMYLQMISSSPGIALIRDIGKRLLSWPVVQSRQRQTVSCQVEVLSRVTQSGLLNEADQSFLGSIQRYMREERQVDVMPRHPVPLLHVFVSGLLFLGSSVCFFFPRIMSTSPAEQPLLTAAACTEVVLGAILLLISLSICIRGLRQGRASRAFDHVNDELDECIQREETFLKCFRRSLRYIQEVEVLSRGYTMVNVPSGNRGTSDVQLLPLRKVCLLVITRHLSTVRTALHAVIDRFPVPTEYKLSADTISNQKIPQWITDMAANSQMLEEHTEEEFLSLSTLKILFGLYKEQCSDFYRQLAISFIYSDELSCAEETDLQEFQNWLKIITEASTECGESTNRLIEAYKVHRWSPTPDVTDKPREVSRREVWRPEVQCTTAIHSLRLHLETMLSRISPTDDELTESEVVNITDDRVAELQVLLTELTDHMEASQICCQEARASLDKLAGREEPKDMGGDDTAREVDTAQSQEPIERIPITAEYPEDIEGDLDEQIFEAYIDVKRKLQEEDDSEEWLQERIQKRREAEDAKRMLQELNSVLTKRSEERERNKQQKLLEQQKKQTETPPPTADGRGDSNNTVPPAEHGYSSPTETNTEDDSPAVQSSERDNSESERPHQKASEQESSMNASEHGDIRVDGMEPPSNEYSLGMENFSQGIRDEEIESSIHPVGSVHESGTAFTNRDSPKMEQEGTSESVPACSYECDSSDVRVEGHGASSDLSTERSLFLPVNSWMASGLAAQVARISLERNNLSEETFGGDDESEED